MRDEKNDKYLATCGGCGYKTFSLILGTCKRCGESDIFTVHLEKTSEEVSKWPKWKQDILKVNKEVN